MFWNLVPTLLFISTTQASLLPFVPPYPALCPTKPLVRPAEGLSIPERTYRTARKAKADLALRAWLQRTNPGFGTGSLPTVALTSSGGGYRSMLISAGVVQGFDARESNKSTSGIYQALTYHTGLGEGAWMLFSLAAAGYPTVSNLNQALWKDAMKESLLDPETLAASWTRSMIPLELWSKLVLGMNVSVIDVYGRLLSSQLMREPTTLSSIADISNLTSHGVPFPIMTAVGDRLGREDWTRRDAVQYEFSPFEFGSWDKEVSGFTDVSILGSSVENGHKKGWLCKKKFDDLGFILGTSANMFPAVSSASVRDKVNQLLDVLVDMVPAWKSPNPTSVSLFGLYPNPFYKYQSPTGVHDSKDDIRSQPFLRLIGGGMSHQNNPIFPLLQPARAVDVIIVNDNSANTNNYPNGSEIYTTYLQSLEQGLSRMPYIPPVELFLLNNFQKKAVFFGCHSRDKITIIWLPNHRFSYASNIPSTQMTYRKDQTDRMIEDGAEVASQGND